MQLWVLGHWHELLGEAWHPVMSGPNWAGGWFLVSQAAHVQQVQILIQVNNPCAEHCDGSMRGRGVPLQRIEAESLQVTGG
jgi:hypothetical protein